MRKVTAIVFLTALSLAACSSNKPESAEEYYGVANRHLQDGAYPMAIEHYRELLHQPPFSELSEEAEFKITLAHFQNRACPEAIAAFSISRGGTRPARTCRWRASSAASATSAR